MILERETGIEPATFSLGKCISRVLSITYWKYKVPK